MPPNNNRLESFLSELAHLGSISDPKVLADFMSVERLPYKSISPQDFPAVRAFRHLNAQARVQLCQRVLNDILPGGPPTSEPEPNPVVFTYEQEVSIGGPPQHKSQKAQEALNHAWGFEDGNCNSIDDNCTIVGKSRADNPAFIEAHYCMNRHTRVTIEVSLRKNGEKSFRLKPR